MCLLSRQVEVRLSSTAAGSFTGGGRHGGWRQNVSLRTGGSVISRLAGGEPTDSARTLR